MTMRAFVSYFIPLLYLWLSGSVATAGSPSGGFHMDELRRKMQQNRVLHIEKHRYTPNERISLTYNIQEINMPGGPQKDAWIGIVP